MNALASRRSPADAGVRLFLSGDVMTGRGIDQILPHPSAPQLHESFVRSAGGYVDLAERASGPVGRGHGFTYPWGDALELLDQWEPVDRIINLETAVTTSDDAQPGKGIHYRMHPANIACLTGAGIDCAVLANNHVLDWGRGGLADTLQALRTADVCCAGAGRNASEAAGAAVLDLPSGGRLLVFAFAVASSGVPAEWAATASRPGVNDLGRLDAPTAQTVAQSLRPQRRRGDLVMASIHWGGNWGFELDEQQRAFARTLIDSGAVDVVHGHSSHHPQGIEIVHGKLVLHTGPLMELAMVPLRRRRLRLERASSEDADWLARTLQRETQRFGDGALVSRMT